MIGEEPNEALLCLTDLHQFINDSEAIRNVGQWYFLNGSSLLNVSLNTTEGIYMTSDLGVVRLHQKTISNNYLRPVGRFQCDILDSNKTRQHIYIRVYYESVSTTSTSLASHPDTSFAGSSLPGSDPESEANSSPTTCCVSAEAEVSVAVIGGAGVGGLLLVLIIVAVGIILVILLIKR